MNDLEIDEEFNATNVTPEKTSLKYFVFLVLDGHRFELASCSFSLLITTDYSLMVYKMILKRYKTGEFITVQIDSLLSRTVQLLDFLHRLDCHLGNYC